MKNEKEKYDLKKGKTVCNWCGLLVDVREMTSSYESSSGIKYLVWRGCFKCYVEQKKLSKQMKPY